MKYILYIRPFEHSSLTEVYCIDCNLETIKEVRKILNEYNPHFYITVRKYHPCSFDAYIDYKVVSLQEACSKIANAIFEDTFITTDIIRDWHREDEFKCRIPDTYARRTVGNVNYVCFNIYKIQEVKYRYRNIAGDNYAIRTIVEVLPDEQKGLRFLTFNK